MGWFTVGGFEELEPLAGFEPATCCLRNSCSTTELKWPTGLVFRHRYYVLWRGGNWGLAVILEILGLLDLCQRTPGRVSAGELYEGWPGSGSFRGVDEIRRVVG